MDEHIDEETMESPPCWIVPDEELAREIGAFIKEFGSFTPEWFAEVKFHLLRGSGLTKDGRREFCNVSIAFKLCPNCDLLYTAKKCPLWYDLFKKVQWKSVERAPPCIRLAYARHNIKTVTDYLVAVNLIAPPFYGRRRAPTCKMMQRWNLCEPDRYCEAMTTGNTAEYMSARERVKLSRTFPSGEEN